MSGCLQLSVVRATISTQAPQYSSWLAATYDGVDLLEHSLKPGSMFKFNGKCFAVIELYPRAKDVEFDTISTAVPSRLGS